MAVLMIKCPRTGQDMSTGRERSAARDRSTAIEIGSIL
jgi:hypothetical protein